MNADVACCFLVCEMSVWCNFEKLLDELLWSSCFACVLPLPGAKRMQSESPVTAHPALFERCLTFAPDTVATKRRKVQKSRSFETGSDELGSSRDPLKRDQRTESSTKKATRAL